jgi:hypothetical protein
MHKQRRVRFLIQSHRCHCLPNGGRQMIDKKMVSRYVFFLVCALLNLKQKKRNTKHLPFNERYSNTAERNALKNISLSSVSVGSKWQDNCQVQYDFAECCRIRTKTK